MKLNKQIVSVTLASTMILSSTSMTLATSFDSKSKEISVEESIEEQSLEKLNEVIAAVENAQETNLQEDVDLAKELIESLTESETKDDLVSRLESTQGSIDKVEVDKAVTTELIEKITTIPAPEGVTIEHKPVIQEAINTYNNLTEDQKGLVESEYYDKLFKSEDIISKLEQGQSEASEELKQAMSLVEEAEQIRLQEDVNIAKELVEALPESETRNTLVSRLGPVQESINKAEQDKTEAKALIDKINTLPASEDLTIKHKSVVEEAINSYNNLTEDQKDLVESKCFNKLLAAEDVVNKLEEQANTEAADKVNKLINNLNKSVKIEAITEKYITSVEEVREAYDTLNDNAKALVSESNVDKLERVKANVAETKAVVKSVQDKIKALPKDMSGNGEAVLDAKKEYDALSNTAKKFINKELKTLLNNKVKEFKSFTKGYFPGLNKEVFKEENLNKKQQILNIAKTNLSIAKKLETNETRIDYYEKAINKAERQVEKAKEKADKIVAESVDLLLVELSNDDFISQALVTEAETARKTYNALNDNAKTKVSQSNIGKLKEIEDKVSRIKTLVKSVEDKITALPKKQDVLEHGKAILKTRNSYNDLSDESKSLMNAELKLSLDEAIESFKSFNEDDLSNLSKAVSQESDLKKKQQLINLTQGNFNLVKEIGIDQIEKNHYQSLINEAQKQVNAINIRILIDSFNESVSQEEITEEYITKVKTAKRAYDSLSPGAKAFIAETGVLKLEQANTLIDTTKEQAVVNTNKLIANISQTDTISKELVNEIDTAQKAYNSLNNDSRSLVTEDNIEKLKGLENIKVKIAELKISVKPVEDRIALLPENKNMLGYGKAILKSKKAYDDLSSEAKVLISEDSNALLNGALKDFKSFTKNNISSLNKSVSKEINLDTKQELVNISQKSLDFAKQLEIEEAQIIQYQSMIDEAQEQVDTVNEKVSSKEVANKVDKLISSFNETVNLEDVTEDYLSKVEIASKAYNLLNNDSKVLVLKSNVDKLVRVETKLATGKAAVKAVENKISELPEDIDILKDYEIILKTKKSYDVLSDTAKSFMDQELKSSLIKMVENFKRLTIDGVSELQGSISNANTLKDKRSIVEKAPAKLERAKNLGMELDEYEEYQAIIKESDNIVSELEKKAIELKEATIEAENAVANLSEDITIKDKEAINTTRSLVNKTLALDSNVKIKGIEKLESAETECKELRKQSILTTIGSLNEENTKEEVKGILHLLADTTLELDMNTIKSKNLSRYLDGLIETTIKSEKDVQGVVAEINDTVAKLEAAMSKAEDAVVNLPTIENIEVQDKMQVVNAKALIESVKVFDENATVKDQEKIAGLDARITELEQAKKVEDKISNLAVLDKLTLENKPVAEEALNEYKNLTIYQQSLVGNIDDLFSVKSELEEESDKSQQAEIAITKAKESNSEKDIGMAKALINMLSQDEDKENLASKLNIVEKQVDKTEDEEIVAMIKSEMKFATQITDVIVKPLEIDGVSFKMNADNVKGIGLIRDAEVNADGNIDITRELSTRTTFDMTVTIQKGEAKNTKLFNVIAEGSLWPGNSVTTIKAQD